MSTGIQPPRAQAPANDANATHGKILPISNRQKLARLEIVVTHTEQTPDPISNRQFLRPARPLPWIQLQLKTLQLQLPGHLYPTKSAAPSEEIHGVAPAPEGRPTLGRSLGAGRRNKKEAPSAGGATDRTATARASFASPGPFLITQSAIRNRCNSNKTKLRHGF